ncbi:cryptochrome/photolyase family protein [Pseudomonadota bacterium]
MNILLLQRELRIEDNNLILSAAELNQDFLPVFIFDKSELLKVKNKESKNINFLIEAVLKLKNDLQKQGSDLIIFYGKKYDILSRIVKTLNSETIISGKTYDLATINLYKKLNKLCKVLEIKDSFLTDFEIVKDNSEAFKVYTPYKNKFLKSVKIEKPINQQLKLKKINFSRIKTLLKKEKLYFIDSDHSEEVLNKIGFKKSELGDFSIEDADKKFNKFFEKGIFDYHKTRDYPDIEGTSKLSPYLRYGLISIRKCFYECLKNKKKKGITTWMLELIWREFYATTLYHFPKMQSEEFMEKYSKLKWNYDNKKLKLWKEGKTGYPIIDAGMRQLKETGWMHNRMRMVVASFLTKNLFIDWRLGEEHFADYLIDYEPASNIGGWQWSASVGIDPQPYFRIFNPFNQSKKFDKNANYIQKYIPELKNIEPKVIHSDTKINEYFDKIVDYKKSRKVAIKNFKNVTD